MDDVVIVAALRTGVGKFGGTIGKIPASELGAKVITALLAKTGVKPDMISEVLLGQVLTAAVGQNPARQASIRAGLPHMVPAMTINKVCGSGLKATHLAAQAIKAGDADIVIAGGQENMTLARIKAYSSAGVDPSIMGIGPIPASQLCLKKAGWTPKDIDLLEINEAFAAQAIAVNRDMGWDTLKVNVNGGEAAGQSDRPNANQNI